MDTASPDESRTMQDGIFVRKLVALHEFHHVLRLIVVHCGGLRAGLKGEVMQEWGVEGGEWGEGGVR